ncbi:MAG: antibiotic biosynthesis monooxygenase [Methyloceanibacter sp.]|nr:antibiotic biosynthesis monooxygenase [Methyloceanibacter sp.]
MIAYHHAKPGKEQALREALLQVCAPTRGEKGCVNYDLHVSPDDPGLLVFHENWVSKTDLDAHLASPHIDDFRAVAPDLLAEPPDITLWTEVEE